MIDERSKVPRGKENTELEKFSRYARVPFDPSAMKATHAVHTDSRHAARVAKPTRQIA